MLFLCYPRCSTCQKAGRWLEDRKIAYSERNIAEELSVKDWYEWKEIKRKGKEPKARR